MTEEARIQAQTFGDQTAERDIWEPTLTVRPHHVLMEEFMASLLKLGHGLYIADDIPEMLVDRYGSSDPYVHDLLGSTRADSRSFVEGVNGFYARVRDLQDGDVVGIDINKDGLCEAAAIGRHCTAINFKMNGYSRGELGKEIKSLVEISELLQKVGAREGIDFIMQPIQGYEFQDFQGKEFDSATANCPVLILFRGMRVKVEVLRAAIDKYPSLTV